KRQEAAVNGSTNTPSREGTGESTTFQIITGSYERVLHGFTATIPHNLITKPDNTSTTTQDDDQPKISFSDTFLFNAHASSIRCLALSPPTPESTKILLATGSTDERINIYTLSKTPPPAPSSSKPHPAPTPKPPTLNGPSTTTENAKNKELGSLLHHSSSVTALFFPSRAKLLSASEDSTIAITRTRDWEPLSSIKAPIPKPQGRPSGDTAAPGEVPSGINAFAVHPSMKLMVSVSKGEKCMRLWNLVTGKKAGVLNFNRDILASVGEGRFASGEGRGVVWDHGGEEFAVAFERGVVVFGVDCRPKARILPWPRTKVHQVMYLPPSRDGEHNASSTLSVSTEDGRIMLYDTDSTTSPNTQNSNNDNGNDSDNDNETIPSISLIAQVGGPAAGITSRVKQFAVLPVSASTSTSISTSTFLILAGSSDGTVRLWSLDTRDLKDADAKEKDKGFAAKQVGTLLGTYSTGTRITCLTAFAMTGAPEEDRDGDGDEEGEGESDDESSKESE
ncbi:WD40 repeat-like protein, partial [Byssothecium circinans]